MIEEYRLLVSQVKSQRKQIKKTLKKLNALGTKKADALVHPLQAEIVNEIDCLKCANCCSTTSPLFRDVDIKRLAKFVGEKESDFIDKRLELDPEDGYYALKKSPCCFLGEDNYCVVYSARPKACAEFPHTDRKNFIGISKLSEKNSRICPIVAKLLIKVEEQL